MYSEEWPLLLEPWKSDEEELMAATDRVHPAILTNKPRFFYKIARKIKLSHIFNSRDLLQSLLREFSTLKEVEVHISLTKAKKLILIQESNNLRIEKLLVPNRDFFDWKKLREKRDTVRICPLMVIIFITVCYKFFLEVDTLSMCLEKRN